MNDHRESRRCTIARKKIAAENETGSQATLEAPTAEHVSAGEELDAVQFALQAARLAKDTKCHSVAVLDVTGLSPVCDFIVLATGTSNRQMRSVAQDLWEFGAASGNPAFRTGGLDGDSWIIIDCVHVVIHVFSQDARMFYDLDNLWGDAKRTAI